jgi:flagellar protein FlaG
MSIAPTGISQGNDATPKQTGGKAVPRPAGAVGIDAAAQKRATNLATKSLNNSVQLSLDSQSGKAIVRVVDPETGQVVRQIPTEEVLELRRAFDRLAGLLIDRTA